MPPFFIFLGLDNIKKLVYYMNHKRQLTSALNRKKQALLVEKSYKI